MVTGKLVGGGVWWLSSKVPRMQEEVEQQKCLTMKNTNLMFVFLEHVQGARKW